jgi:lysyl-tRNA synthetase class 2
MKRLLCAGSGDIFQIGPVFRDGEAGRHHNPEFTMIEWYRLGYDHHDMADETVALIETLLETRSEVVRISYRDAFRRYAGIDPFTSEPAGLAAVCRRNKIAQPDAMSDDRDQWLDLLMGAVVAPAFPPDRIHVLYDYPASQAALARIRPQQPPVAERFEVFHGGLELANGFHELADAAEQRQRFETEQARYAATGRTTPPVDQNLLAALESGLPDCAGVALGFDRLLMLATGQTRLADVIAFPFDRI